MTKPIYLDHNASTPAAPEVVEELARVLREVPGNALSVHAYGRAAREVIERARARVASLLSARADEIVFTSGGTESNNAAVYGVAEALASRGRHIVTTVIEHASVERPCRVLESRGFEVTRVGVRPDGTVDPREVVRALRPDTVLVSMIHAQNETGALQPVAAIARAARDRGIVVHTDASQSVGKVAVDVEALGVDLLTVAGHKLYAPQGIGALYLRAGTPFRPLVLGAGHQADRRSGTETVALAAALGAACDLAAREGASRHDHLRTTRDRLEAGLASRVPGLVVHAATVERLPNTLYAAFPGVAAHEMLERMDGVAAGAGAACHAGVTTPSKVLTAMGVRAEIAAATLRLTTGRSNTLDQMDEAIERIVAAMG